jgi:hypothetical protein
MENYLHRDAICEAYQDVNIAVTFTAPFGDFDDVPSLVAEAVHAAGGGNPWAALDDKKCASKVSHAKRRLNSGAIAKMTRARLAETDPADELIGWLNHIKETVAAA